MTWYRPRKTSLFGRRHTSNQCINRPVGTPPVQARLSWTQSTTLPPDPGSVTRRRCLLVAMKGAVGSRWEIRRDRSRQTDQCTDRLTAIRH
ncbi:hypothetical protein GDO78_017865 [Eleutherodactylus coqui]|uniref:Uncharacterized protein n=1 Tax=Eleutherodactylus coqui TaxID=57060 RepID=A0A8J6BCQ7_ELECQ|nr:hypothetical protein GDO78_017865 [Eleutherodactylus coqui]